MRGIWRKPANDFSRFAPSGKSRGLALLAGTALEAEARFASEPGELFASAITVEERVN